MEKERVFKILGIEETNDKDLIGAAYRQKLITVNPEDDAEGFMQLREAYETAINLADRPDDEVESERRSYGLGPEIDELMWRAEDIYADIFVRCDEKQWEEWLSDPLCSSVDTFGDVRTALLIFLSYNYYFPNELFRLFNRAFRIVEDADELKNDFSPNFLGFLIGKINSKPSEDFDYGKLIPRKQYDPNFVTGGLTFDTQGREYRENPDEQKYGEYINKVIRADTLYDEASENEDPQALENVKNYVSALVGWFEESEIYHPFEEIIKMRAAILTGQDAYARALATDIVNKKSPVYDERVAIDAVSVLVHYAIHDTGIEVGMDRADDLKPLNLNDFPISECNAILDDTEEVFGSSAKWMIAKAGMRALTEDYVAPYPILTEIYYLIPTNADGLYLQAWLKNSTIAGMEEAVATETDEKQKKFLIKELADAYLYRNEDEKVLEIFKDFEPDAVNEYSYHVIQGQAYMRLENKEKAIEKLQASLEYIYRKKENIENGIKDECFEKDLERIRECFRLEAILGSTYGTLDDLENAEKYMARSFEHMKERIENDPEFTYDMLQPVTAAYAEMMDRKEKYAEAYKLWDYAYSVCNEPGALAARQRAAYWADAKQQVINDYSDLHGIDPGYQGAYEYAVLIFMQEKMPEEAGKIVDEAVANNIEADFITYYKAERAAEEGDVKTALELYKGLYESVKNGESNLADKAYVLYMYAELLGKNKGDDRKERLAAEAEIPQILEYAAAQGHAFPNLYYSLCRRYDDLWLHTEKPEAASKAKEAAALYLEKTDRISAYIDSIFIGLDIGDLEAACAYADKALEQDDSDMYALNAAAKALQYKGELEKAAEKFEQAIAIEKKEYSDRKNALLEEGKDPSEENIRRFVAVYRNYRRCLTRLKDYDRAIEIQKEVIELDGDDYEKQQLAYLYRYNGDAKQALKTFKEMKIDLLEKRMDSDLPFGEDEDPDVRIILTSVDIIDTAVLFGMMDEAEEEYRYISGKVKSIVQCKNRSDKMKSLVKRCFDTLGQCTLFTLRKESDAIDYFRVDYEGYDMDIQEQGDCDFDLREKAQSASHLVSAYLFMSVRQPERREEALQKAKEYGEEGIRCLTSYSNGDLDHFLDFPKDIPMRAYLMGDLLYGMGEKDRALEIANKGKAANVCYSCTHATCYEYYLSMARFMEYEGKYKEALEYYKQAQPDSHGDAEVYNAIRALTETVKD